MTMQSEERVLMEKMMETTSYIVTFLPKIHTLIKNVETLVAGRADERDIQTLKQKIITFLNKIIDFTQGEKTAMLAAQRGSSINWEPFLALNKGQVAKIQEIQKKLAVSLYAPNFRKEMETLFSELTKRYEEELVQLRAMATTAKKQAA